MDVYVFQGALYCCTCGEALVRSLRERGVEDTGDSDAFPQGSYPDGGGEADTPQHCDSGAECLAADEIGNHRVGAFLENPLNGVGDAYVRHAIAETPGSPLVGFWAEHYGITRKRDDLD
jgi:hypothetical protein